MSSCALILVLKKTKLNISHRDIGIELAGDFQVGNVDYKVLQIAVSVNSSNYRLYTKNIAFSSAVNQYMNGLPLRVCNFLLRYVPKEKGSKGRNSDWRSQMLNAIYEVLGRNSPESGLIDTLIDSRTSLRPFCVLYMTLRVWIVSKDWRRFFNAIFGVINHKTFFRIN